LAVIAVTLFVVALRGRGPRLAGTIPAVAVLGQISLGIGIVLTGGDGRTHELLAGAHEAGAGLVWGLLVALATLSRPGERLPLRQHALRPANEAPVAQRSVRRRPRRQRPRPGSAACSLPPPAPPTAGATSRSGAGGRALRPGWRGARPR